MDSPLKNKTAIGKAVRHARRHSSTKLEMLKEDQIVKLSDNQKTNKCGRGKRITSVQKRFIEAASKSSELVNEQLFVQNDGQNSLINLNECLQTSSDPSLDLFEKTQIKTQNTEATSE
mmetsp:Transcript_8332/g.9456  ORF Transcript_8332/g.9456 Transcript_8332/m.9456 type:complete len:118 (+) Transcript_8332:1-354(+)